MTAAPHPHPALNNMPRSLANLLHGEFNLRFEDVHWPTGVITTALEQRRVALANLRVLFDAVLKSGWQTHTGDWDWEVEFTLANGNRCVNINQDWDFTRGVYIVPFEEVTASVEQGLTHIRFIALQEGDEELDYSGEREVHMALDDIVSVRFEEMH